MNVEDVQYNADNIGNGQVVSSLIEEKENEEEQVIEEILQENATTFVINKT